MFTNKTIWITGASSGIGEALAYALSAQGARLILSARRADKLEAVRARCTHPDHHLVAPLDLGVPDTLPATAKEVLRKVSQLDIVVHNGGISQRSLVKETVFEVDRRIMTVNYFGTVALTKAVLPHLLTQGHGHFVVVSSLVGKFSTPYRSAYSASKHALHGFFEGLRAELHDAGIRVTMVCPGFVQTQVSVNALVGDGSAQGQMDGAQAGGMPVEKCAAKMVKAIARKKEEVYIGGFEVRGIYVKRFFPKLFNRIIRSARVT